MNLKDFPKKDSNSLHIIGNKIIFRINIYKF